MSTSLDYTRTTVVRPSSNARVATKRRVVDKEDAGCSINPDADKPYNLLQRMYLRMLGTLLARPLI